MPELNLRDLRKELRFPELRLPEMSRDDIAKHLAANYELSDTDELLDAVFDRAGK